MNSSIWTSNGQALGAETSAVSTRWATGESGWPVKPIVYAPRSLQWSMALRLSSVVPETEVKTAAVRSPRRASPETTSSAAIAARTGSTEVRRARCS